jgi:transcription-repair coupling factor (superfamily II helicase)
MMRLKNGGDLPEEEINTEINIPVNAYIPDTYIQDATQKLLTYKRLSRVRDEEELREMESELKDRYGTLPSPLVNLLEVISLKSLLVRLRIRKAERRARDRLSSMLRSGRLST